MTQFTYGIIHQVVEDNRIIALKYRKRITYTYFPRGMFASFTDYFRSGIYLFLRVQTKSRLYRGRRVFNVIHIEKIMDSGRRYPHVFYDISTIKSGIISVINTNKPRLFIDFEMSMPPYRHYEDFISEIIQAGMILTDSEGNIIERHAMYIRPEFFPKLTDRTSKFLRITQADLDQGISYLEFYSLLRRLNQEYQPMVIVWGRNDTLELSKLNRLHRLRDLSKKMQFVDLLKLHKTYYGLKNDLGLFHAYCLYSGEELRDQRHDAFQDADTTRKVFYWFKETANSERVMTIGDHDA